MFARSIFSALLLGGALATLSACGAGRVDYVHIDSSYEASQYAHLPFTGPLNAEVSGNPFAIPQAEITRIVGAAIQPSGMPVGNGKGVRVHIAFGTTATDVNFACSTAGSVGRIDNTITMVAALCRGGGSALTYLVGSIDGVTGPNDPRFLQFLRQSTIQLFPPRDDSQNTNNCAFPAC